MSRAGSFVGFLRRICLVGAAGPPLLPGLVKRVLAVQDPMVVMRCFWCLEGSGAGAMVVNWAVGSNQTSLCECKNPSTH